MLKGIKTGGRKKGTANKLTLSHRELIQSIFDSEVRSGRVECELKKLEGKDYIDAILKLTGFVLPKLNSVDVSKRDTEIKTILITPASLQKGLQVSPDKGKLNGNY